MKQIIKFLDILAKQTVISSLVMSHLDHANAIFVNLPNSPIYPVQQIQNQAAKLIINKHQFDSPITIIEAITLATH